VIQESNNSRRGKDKKMNKVSKMMLVALAFVAMGSAKVQATTYPDQYYVDAKKVVATHSLRGLTSGAWSQEGVKLDQVVIFANGSDSLTAAGLAKVAKVAAEFKKMGGMHHLMVNGYTDSKGKVAANQSLSERRAAAVVKALVKKYGVPASTVVGRGFGSADPVATNSTATGRAANRRVEFVVMGGRSCH
jgi:outer membrane protein OmpA-like peptidoglycan-associated protein